MEEQGQFELHLNYLAPQILINIIISRTFRCDCSIVHGSTTFVDKYIFILFSRAVFSFLCQEECTNIRKECLICLIKTIMSFNHYAEESLL